MGVFPGAIPAGGSAVPTATLVAAGHTALHNTDRDEIRAIATKIGIDGSLVVTTHDYKLSNVPDGEKATTVSEVLESMYPIGSIYMNATNSENPADLLGIGTWTAFGAGRVPVGINAADTDFDTAEETGGAKTHTLTEAEIPSHTHTQNAHTHSFPEGRDGILSNPGAYLKAGWSNNSGTATAASVSTGSTTGVNQNTGGGGAHNNLQPYIVVYMWKRTA